MKRARAWMVVALVSAGAWQLAGAGWIHAKAAVAQHLIDAAWRNARGGEASRRPWPGADLRPVARLTMPARGIDVMVLDAASPRALAFGPAVVGSTAPPGTWGNTVIAAHRDTHFGFLRNVVAGDVIELEVAGGRRARYRVAGASIVEQDEAQVLEPASARLTLVTCYPFDAVMPGTRWRYVVVADRVA